MTRTRMPVIILIPLIILSFLLMMSYESEFYYLALLIISLPLINVLLNKYWSKANVWAVNMSRALPFFACYMVGIWTLFIKGHMGVRFDYGLVCLFTISILGLVVFWPPTKKKNTQG